MSVKNERGIRSEHVRERIVKRKKEKLEGGISVENIINQESKNLKKINNEIWKDKSRDKD